MAAALCSHNRTNVLSICYQIDNTVLRKLKTPLENKDNQTRLSKFSSVISFRVLGKLKFLVNKERGAQCAKILDIAYVF